jgi:hypothetical protein
MTSAPAQGHALRSVTALHNADAFRPLRVRTQCHCSSRGRACLHRLLQYGWAGFLKALRTRRVIRLAALALTHRRQRAAWLAWRADREAATAADAGAAQLQLRVLQRMTHQVRFCFTPASGPHVRRCYILASWHVGKEDTDSACDGVEIVEGGGAESLRIDKDACGFRPGTTVSNRRWLLRWRAGPSAPGSSPGCGR